MRSSRTSPTLPIRDRLVGSDHPLFIIAEAGVAHFGDMRRARELVDLAVAAGADAVKFQHFAANDLVSPSSREWYDRLASRSLTDEQMWEIARYTESVGGLFLCTPHSVRALRFLVDVLGVPALKIGSGEIGNVEIYRAAAETTLPVLVSTGMHSDDDIRLIVEIFGDNAIQQLALLHCVTGYPVPSTEANLRRIQWLQSEFGLVTGYSDHVHSPIAAFCAIALGATVVERHIALERNVENAQDWRVSSLPGDFPKFVRDCRAAAEMIGTRPSSETSSAGASTLWARRSIAARTSLQVGHVIAEGDLLFLRPGTGLPVRELSRVVGRRVRRPLQALDLLMESDLEELK